MDITNVLITSSGRRTSLLKAFQEATHPRGGLVFAGDMDPLAPTLYLSDGAFELPAIKSPQYIPHLLSLVEKHHIRLLVPTIDTELLVLAQNASLFEQKGCRALISSEEMVRISGDKWLTFQVFSSQGIRVPRSWVPELPITSQLPEKLYVKPRDGSASLHVYRTTREQLPEILPRVPNPIIQEAIEGPEITIDALIGFDGQPLHYVPRRRIRTLGGESIEGGTIPDGEIRDWLCGVLTSMASQGARGPVTLQAFLSPEGPVLSEINPRFGGGFPLAYAAGGRYPQWVLSMLDGETPEARIGEYHIGLCMTRYYVEHFTEAPLWAA